VCNDIPALLFAMCRFVVIVAKATTNANATKKVANTNRAVIKTRSFPKGAPWR
jgi:hypothetical protein